MMAGNNLIMSDTVHFMFHLWRCKPATRQLIEVYKERLRKQALVFTFYKREKAQMTQLIGQTLSH